MTITDTTEELSCVPFTTYLIFEWCRLVVQGNKAFKALPFSQLGSLPFPILQ